MKLDSNEMEDWLQDETFINWVFRSDEADYLRWEKRLSKSPGGRKWAAKARVMLHDVVNQPVVPKEKTQAALERLEKRLKVDLGEGLTPYSDRPIRTVNWWKKPASIAVSITLLVGILALGSYLWPSQYVEIVTGYAEKMEFDLPDGSEVILNANSTLKYRPDSPREVWIDGEAFFHVQKQQISKAKFEVHTTDLSVVVLGTSFNVSNRRNETQVFLEEGSLNVNLLNDQNSQILLEPGDLITFSSVESQSYEKVNVSSPVLTSWKDGVIELKGVYLNEALQKMEDVYGISVRFEDQSLYERTINAVFPIEELEIALQQIEYALNLKIEKMDESTYFIK